MGTLDAMHSWCRANGISVSLCQDSQRSAKDLLDELFTVGNSAPVYSGDKLKVIPYDEVSWAGNGEIYVAPTASGPIIDITLDEIITDGKKLPITITRKKRTDCDNVVAIEFIDRSIDYAHNVVSECDQRAVALYGPRKGGTLDAADLGVNNPSGSKALLSIHEADKAQKIASILAKRGAAGANHYSLTVSARVGSLLEAMDLITVPDDYGFGSGKKAIRLTSSKETEDRAFDIEADEFIYGLNHPDVKDTTAATGTLVQVNVDPGLVNAPIIFEPTSLMIGASGAQIWFLVSGSDPNYGGCIGFVSVDGGSSYTQMGNIGPGTMGLLTADFPSSLDPDTTSSLDVDLSESNGSLESEPQVVADGFADPCIVGVNSSPAVYDYESVCPTDATLTGPETYSLGTYIRRGVQGTPSIDHPSGSVFGVLDGAVLKVDLPPQWIGKQLWFKFAAYNKIGGQLNDLSNCAAYPYTPRGTALSSGGVIGEAPFGAIDGSNQTFGLTSPPLPPFSLLLFFNGAVLRQGTDYTISGSVITLSFAPQPASGSPVVPADWLYAIYRTDGNTSSFDDSVVPSGSIDGANTTFVMPHAPSPAGSLMLFQNGELQLSPGDFSLSSATITDVIAPQGASSSPVIPADWLLAWARRDGISTGNANGEVPSGTINGSNTAFTLAHTPIPVSALMLFKNKILMRPGTDYTIAGTAITCVVAPETGASLVAFYRY